MLREHATAVECRLAGSCLTAVIPYGRRAETLPELFERRSLIPDELVTANLQHDAGTELGDTVAGTLRLEQSDDGLAVEIDVRGATLELARRGALTGMSPEFISLDETTIDGLRRISRARLVGIGVVDVPAYAAPISVRADPGADRLRARRIGLGLA